MQDPRSTSTLELVVNEQQLQNMSQIDLSRPNDTVDPANSRNNQTAEGNGFSCKHFGKLPARIRQSFGAKFNEAKSKSESKTELVFRVIQAFSGLAMWFICFICTILVPVILLFVGLFNIDYCPAKPRFVMTASNLFNLAFSLDLPILTNHSLLSNDTKNTIASIINIIFNCLVAFLYILSSYMVFNVDIKKQDEHLTTDDPENALEFIDCGSLLYYFTFWFVTLTLGLFVVLCLIACSLFLYNQYRLAIIRGSTPRSQPDANATQTNIYATNRV